MSFAARLELHLVRTTENQNCLQREYKLNVGILCYRLVNCVKLCVSLLTGVPLDLSHQHTNTKEATVGAMDRLDTD